MVRWLRPLAGRGGIVAVDGRCAGGKTTLAAWLAARFSCTVLHMDDFFLPFALRTRTRMQTPGGNVDSARFLHEVLRPLAEGRPGSLRTFDCASGNFAAPVPVLPVGLTVVEGSYAMHPSLSPYYAGGVFLTCSPEAQLRRLAARETPARLLRFRDEWIPLEERYFTAFFIESRCVLTLDTTRFDNLQSRSV